jgi:hypothetical protein
MNNRHLTTLRMSVICSYSCVYTCSYSYIPAHTCMYCYVLFCK